MKHSAKRLAQIALGVSPCLALIVVCVIGHLQHPRRALQSVRAEPPRTQKKARPDFVALTERKKVDLKSISGETLRESMLNIITNGQQFFGKIPPTYYGAQDNLETTLAYPRPLKVIQTVETLPAKDREQTCKELFALAFSTHTNTFASVLRMWNDPAYTNKMSMLSSRMGVCLATFIAADSGLRDVLSDELAQLYRFRDEVVERAVAAHPAQTLNDRGFVHNMRRYYVPDNRFQLNLLRLVAVRDADDGNRVLKLVDEELRTNTLRTSSRGMPVTKWDAPASWFDEQLPGCGRRNMDARDVVKQYELLDWGDSRVRQAPEDGDLERQQELVRKLRYLVFGHQG
jgi:hypothetical protein